MNKIELSGISTSDLPTLTEAEKKDLLALAAKGDALAREKLIVGNLRLVLSVIGRFHPKHESAEDLFQVGCVGLIKAIDNFRLDLDVMFSTYAVPMIIGEIRRYLRDNNAVRVSRSMRDLAYRALTVREEFSKRENREPSTAEIAGALSESETAVARALEAIVEPMSLFDSVYNDGEDSVYVIDQIRGDDDSDETLVENIGLAEALKKLSPRERSIIAKRYLRGKTQMEISSEIGISQAQISRIEKGAIDKLRKYMD
ncbi:MAG: SigB/SigF/SigG family RNA polymerase sigma factor [Clostridia bacterium]|nr:SigB/SigF/SigG family RNA polymerase sigma factor [Clostridia bacterium]